ncbi:GNAT family N-acetyltransferase [Sulfitobacter pseudonitzschiae]|uniref:GNAT family N-acetyltransferase n=1 Tax=Pseudosulfitobacter pseudonitzschiae TaxID=1402135 RepID=A0A9Q2RUP4_9RHOB|nr:GNAT family N-acetyltransferase [Pseudosulfitobacter pseudonitzschiae]MBM2294573.1 GNAT family N-acetyltransferase [Pseudosulfitobacter pseudonitzschiae]MBM2299540.1 GNAT family N-acetyltransferase [Pseudosulfitobacter pseudonitzschiae]MBM2304440.1 GNAT family N-acetyltransferase [Pseudosulfitobacter pseudonitzschiae]MBM2314186.1 GNAT family N-acetyltransferase [Pseudosulfitobacter pseudonitzschiae]MBM2319101.1 GNAT family N-acetyltransferase [Pseudosulfitobacter pseudonitzschiae]
MKGYEFVNVLERATIEDYLLLFEKAYGHNNKLTVAYLRWLYEENPHGRAIGFDAYLDGELAAHYVTIPRIYCVGDEKVRGVLSVNTATHPNHQRRGLFTRLAAATYERAANEGYQYVIGVANAQSIHGFLTKLEFKRLGQIGLAFWLRPPPVAPGHVHLDMGHSWLRWRLANPSADYFLTRAGQDEAIINTRRGRAIFSLGRANLSVLPDDIEATAWRRGFGLITLTPVYPKVGKSLFLPERLMPSPWHIILRRLGSELDDMTNFHIDGLSMDTF